MLRPTGHKRSCHLVIRSADDVRKREGEGAARCAGFVRALPLSAIHWYSPPLREQWLTKETDAVHGGPGFTLMWRPSPTRISAMHGDPDELARTAAIDFARRLVPHWQEALSTELLGAYLIGSLAHGGFSRHYSDIDIALVTAPGLSPPALDRVRSDAVSLSADWGPKVSVFWADRHFSFGRFPPLDRIDYLDYAVMLMERECVRPVRPTLEEIRSTCAARRLRAFRWLKHRVTSVMTTSEHKVANCKF
jgi:predicted nucleotidyltransferase